MCDIVQTADDATCADTAHYNIASQVPDDGINIVYKMLLGLDRARYFMLMGQVLSAEEAKDLGLVSEIHRRDQLNGRAWEIAKTLAEKGDLLPRYTRVVLTEPLRKWIDGAVLDHLGRDALAKPDKEDVHSDEVGHGQSRPS